MGRGPSVNPGYYLRQAHWGCLCQPESLVRRGCRFGRAVVERRFVVRHRRPSGTVGGYVVVVVCWWPWEARWRPEGVVACRGARCSLDFGRAGGLSCALRSDVVGHMAGSASTFVLVVNGGGV
jgi:hypothetical protein